MPRIALPDKGRLQDDVKTLLDDAGLPIRGRSKRSLTTSLDRNLRLKKVGQESVVLVALQARGLTPMGCVRRSPRDEGLPRHEVGTLRFP